MKKTNNLVIWAILIIVVLIATVIIIYQKINYQKQVDNMTSNIENEKVEKIERNITSYVGQVTEKGNEYFIIKVSADKNLVREDKLVKVKVDANTEYSISIIPQKIDTSKPSEEIQKMFRNLDAKFDDIKTDDTVIVFSAVNVAGKSEFVANKVVIRRVN